jgi:hypothetical protein
MSVGLVVIDVEFNKEDYGLIPTQEGVENHLSIID